jgi:hypothetical protein
VSLEKHNTRVSREPTVSGRDRFSGCTVRTGSLTVPTPFRAFALRIRLLYAGININGPAQLHSDGYYYTNTAMIANSNYNADDPDNTSPINFDIYICDLGLYGRGAENYPPLGSPPGTTVSNGLITLKQVQNQGVFNCTIQSSASRYRYSLLFSFLAWED